MTALQIRGPARRSGYLLIVGGLAQSRVVGLCDSFARGNGSAELRSDCELDDSDLNSKVCRASRSGVRLGQLIDPGLERRRGNGLPLSLAASVEAARVKPRRVTSLRGDFHISGIRVGWRNTQPFEAHTFQVELDGFLHMLFDFFARLPGRNAAFQIRRIRRVPGVSFFDDDKIFSHGFKPACFRMLFKVPGASSSLRLPGMVTSPGLVGCLYW